jgi:quercetin dioxygenase-like cupin family protein
MRLSDIAFGTTEWSEVAPEVHAGDSGEAVWRKRYFGPEDNPIRVRMVEYSAGYAADHWCEKGHILLCLAGEMTTTLEDGRTFRLSPGVSYQVADGAERHRSASEKGATLFIVD